MNDRANVLLQGRRGRMARTLGRPLSAPSPAEPPLADESLSHLTGEAESLYWNELEWEHITGEEEMDGGPLVQLTFPGLLAFVRGVLLDETMPDALAPADPRPEVAEAILLFLGSRVLELEEKLATDVEDDRERLEGELAMTDGLVDQVLYLIHGLSAADVERLERAPPAV